MLTKIVNLARYRLKLNVRDKQGMFFIIMFPIIFYTIWFFILKGQVGYNQMSQATDYLLPMYIGTILCNGGVLFFGSELVNLLENKHYIRYKLLGMDTLSVGIATAISGLIVQTFSMAILLVYSFFVSQATIPLANALNIIATTILISVFQYSLGYFLSSIVKKVSQYNTLALIVFFYQLFLGGVAMPMEIFPDNFKTVLSIINPIYHGMTALIGTWVDNLSFFSFPKEILILSGVSLALIVVGRFIYNQRQVNY